MNSNPITKWIDEPPFACRAEQKRARMLESLRYLSTHHYQHCTAYRNLLDHAFEGERSCQFESLEDVPFVPVSLFKSMELKSISEAEVFKTLRSSGTSGESLSQVFLDKDTAQMQSKVLVKIAQHFLGKQRRPMVILDHRGTIENRHAFSARATGILGMSQFGREPFFALREDMSLDVDGLNNYIQRFASKGVLFFGFTFMAWKHFVLEAERQKLRFSIHDGILVHSGGWKKLTELAVSAKDFRERVSAVTGISSVINFYGMVEQVGSIFFENPLHYLHTPIFSDVIVRDPVSLRPLPHGEVGLVQVLSMIPLSYPGHSILTEDLGVIRGEDNASLEMKGKYFEILGRVPQSQLRGCSDVYATTASEHA